MCGKRSFLTHESIQNEHFSSMGSALSGSASRLTRMAASGNKIAIFKLAGIVSLVIIVLWWIKGFFF
jgi:blocked early in transport 1